jgi:hypothetical protein
MNFGSLSARLARAPADDLANQPRGAHEGNDFPDVPAANRPGRSGRSGRDQDQPDLDQFAERFGIGHDDDDAGATERIADRSRSGLGTRVARVVSVGIGAMATVLRASAGALERLSSALRPDDQGD